MQFVPTPIPISRAMPTEKIRIADAINTACVVTIFLRLLGVARRYTIEPLSTYLTINLLPSIIIHIVRYYYKYKSI